MTGFRVFDVRTGRPVGWAKFTDGQWSTSGESVARMVRANGMTPEQALEWYASWSNGTIRTEAT